MTNLLEITTDDVESELNPMGLSLLTQIGEGGISEAKAMDVIERKVALVLSSVPETYRRCFRRIDGEKVVRDASAGQRTFRLGLYPVVEGSVQLFVDYFQNTRSVAVNVGGLDGLAINSSTGARNPDFGQPGDRPYRSRCRQDALPSSAYTVDWETGEVTLATGLTINSTVHADYEHTAMGRCHMLRDIALALIVAKMREILLVPGGASDEIEREERRATAILMSIQEGTAGIDFFDELQLETETRNFERTPQKRLTLPF